MLILSWLEFNRIILIPFNKALLESLNVSSFIQASVDTTKMQIINFDKKSSEMSALFPIQQILDKHSYSS